MKTNIQQFSGTDEVQAGVFPYGWGLSVMKFDIRRTGVMDEHTKKEIVEWKQFKFPSNAALADVRELFLESYLDYEGFPMRRCVDIMMRRTQPDLQEYTEAAERADGFAGVLMGTVGG